MANPKSPFVAKLHVEVDPPLTAEERVKAALKAMSGRLAILGRPHCIYPDPCWCGADHVQP